MLPLELASGRIEGYHQVIDVGDVERATPFVERGANQYRCRTVMTPEEASVSFVGPCDTTGIRKENEITGKDGLGLDTTGRRKLTNHRAIGSTHLIQGVPRG